MKRADFESLPAVVQVRAILEAFPAIEEKLSKLEAPQRPNCPKYDERIRRKGGFQFSSESDIESLHYFHGRATGDSSAEFAERNAKEASALARWIRWREYHPTEAWTGERNRVQVTAKPPSSRAELHTWEARNAAPSSTTTTQTSSVNFRALDGDDSDESSDEGEGEDGF